MKIYAYEYCCYIMVVNKNITRDSFLEKAGIHGGYAKDMFCRLYDSIFAESENLLDSYGKYFHQEFSSLDEMLEKKYNVPQDIINQFLTELAECPDYTLICFDSLSYGENTENLLCSGVLNERLDKLLLMKV